jgi:hypothetical protein
MKTEEILSLARTVLTFVGSWVVQRGYIDDATLQMVVGAILTLASSGWSIYDKVRTRATINSLQLSVASLQADVTTLEASDKIDDIQS